ncbi:glycoside hydrolase family 32 protein [Microbacterium sp.]|uniref:glycoside hydrolase family 32 protein n=1 Tax=Microbacterium sp. TaxID=51671 RepID=UPI003F6FF091
MRPQFHFTAQSGWINDPHGITFRDGGYDSFFQYVPGRTTWAPDCHWGHARGTDLFSLEELPVAIAPGEGDGGIWTGSLVTGVDGGTRIFYTSTSQPNIGIGRVRVATPDDDEWMSWTKGEFVVDAPTGLDLVAYRDPFLRSDLDGWRMFVGAGDRAGTAMALSYRSDDLENWAYEGVALERSTNETADVWMGALWECPQIIDVEGRAVMVSSVWEADALHYAGYAIGVYQNGRFVAERWGRLTWGDSYYAPSYFRDDQDRPCLMFWMRGIADFDAGWASAHSIPYVLTVEDDVLVAAPHPDIERYRSPEASGLAADISWTPDTAGLNISSGGDAVASLELSSPEELTLRIGEAVHSFPVSGDVRVIVDGPVLEVASRGGLFGSAVAPHGEALLVRAGDASEMTVHPLTRQGVS